MAKTALITGGNRGIGQEVARVLATEGWDVLIGSRDRAKGEAAAARLRKATGGRVKGVELDVTSDASVANAVQKLRDGAIKIDALVNNAGVYGASSSAAQTLETNFFGPLRVTLAVLPLLRDGATITNVTSDLAAAYRRLFDDVTKREALIERAKAQRGDAYGISKAALDAWTRILASELAGRNIRVNSTCPGWVRTDMGGRNAPRSIEQGAASVLFGVKATVTGGIYTDGRPV